MKRPFARAVVLFAALAMMVSSCSRRGSDNDKTIGVAESDADMAKAIAIARDSLPHFWKVFEHPQRGENDFCLKVKITEGEEVEHFWAEGIERKDGKIYGMISNEPEFVKKVKNGDRIQIPEADISDWFYMRDGKMVGNYTLRVLFKQMPKKEVQAYKEKLADP